MTSNDIREIPIRHHWPLLLIMEIPSIICLILMGYVLKQGSPAYAIVDYIFLFTGTLVMIGGIWMITDFIISYWRGEI